MTSGAAGGVRRKVGAPALHAAPAPKLRPPVPSETPQRRGTVGDRVSAVLVDGGNGDATETMPGRFPTRPHGLVDVPHQQAFPLSAPPVGSESTPQPKIDRGRYAETIRLGWSTSEILRSATTEASR